MAGSDTKRFDGKVAVITGAGRGIGRAEALLFAAEGARVVVNDLGGGSAGGGGDPAVAQAVVDEIKAAGGEAVVDTSSISSWEGGRQLIEAVIKAYGRIDFLSNNAGIARVRRVDEMDEVDWDTVHGVNLKGYASTIRHAAPYFIGQGFGVIVNKSSPSGFGHYSNGIYSAAKEGVIGLTRTTARDLGEFGVRCNAIRPFSAGSQMATPEMSETLKKSAEMGFTPLWNRPPMPRSPVTAGPEHVAAMTVWLCTDATANVNGRDFFINGSEAGVMPEPELKRSAFAHDGWSLEAFLDPGNLAYLIGDERNRFRKAQ